MSIQNSPEAVTLEVIMLRMKYLVALLVSDQYQELEQRGYCSAAGLREVVEDYPGIMTYPPDSAFVETIKRALVYPESRVDPIGEIFVELSDQEALNSVISNKSRVIVEMGMWFDHRPEDLIFCVEFNIDSGQVSECVGDLRVY